MKALTMIIVLAFAAGASAEPKSIHDSSNVIGMNKAAAIRLCKSTEGSRWDAGEGACVFAETQVIIILGYQGNVVVSHTMMWADGDGSTALTMVGKVKGIAGPADAKRKEDDCDVWIWLGVEGYNFYVGSCSTHSVIAAEKS